MTPVEQAAAVYDREPCARTFREDLTAHLLHGYVFSTPDFFAMGRPVSSTAEPALIVDPWVEFEYPDAWLVYLVAGDMRKALTMVPYPLAKIGLEKRNKLRFYGFAELTTRLCRSSSTIKTPSTAHISNVGSLAPMAG